MSNIMEAELTVRPKQTSMREEFVAIVSLVNRSSEMLIVNLAPLTSPSLALDIVDARGDTAPLPPPPVPGLPQTRIQLGSGERHVIEFNGFVPQWFAPGHYRVRLHYTNQPPTPEPNEWTGQVFSDWYDFTISQ